MSSTLWKRVLQKNQKEDKIHRVNIPCITNYRVTLKNGRLSNKRCQINIEK